MNNLVYMSALGIVNPLGVGKKQVAANLFSGVQSGMVWRKGLLTDQTVRVGAVTTPLPQIPIEMPHYNTRNNRLMLLALQEIDTEIRQVIEQYGADRVAVVLGTSTMGLSDAEPGIIEKINTGSFPDTYDYKFQEPAGLSEFVVKYYGLKGQAVTISTACTSSAKAIAAARRYMNAGMCDAAIVGGTDTLCRLTVNGFDALNSLSADICNPFSVNRDGINIGEGAAAVLLTRTPADIALLGVGETSDAHHINAPDPEGKGALRAMEAALTDANLTPSDIGYVNLHGTATPLNDAMEGRAVAQLFGPDILSSSTKAMTGHMLGAAGVNEAAFLWLMLTCNDATLPVPPHLWDACSDPDIPLSNFAKVGQRTVEGAKALLSNSFAFGGNNISLIMGKG